MKIQHLLRVQKSSNYNNSSHFISRCTAAATDSKQQQVNELRDIGCDVFYTLKDVRDASSEVIYLAQAQIGAGIGALVTSLAVPPALSILGNLAGTLIAEGISDVVAELLSKDDNGVNWKIYAGGKATYGIAVVTMG